MRELPLPDHFRRERASEIYRVPYEERAMEAARFRERHGIPPASADAISIGLLLVDLQNTFAMPGFELFVSGRSGRGASEDAARLSEFLYRNLASITRIHATLDTHRAFQIFHPAFLLDEEGNHPRPMTAISLEDVEEGRFRVNPEVAGALSGVELEYLERHLLHYCRMLSREGKYRLMVWPYHAMLGGIGHAMVPVVEEAVFFHGIARHSQASFELKGANPLTENYSVLSPEVLEDHEGKPIASRNSALLDRLLSYDALLVAGEAKSHCVSWTLSDLLEEIRRRDLGLANKIYLLEDCTSAVCAPGVVDFTDDAERAFDEFAASGMHRVRSTDPMSEWPGFPEGV
ncbi:MAG TPA: isochorismatase [Vicinamibacteria bacterium]